MKNLTILVVLGALILASMSLKLWNIESQSLWFDEGWSAHAAAQPTIIAAANADSTNPPLYYALIHVAARLWGDSEFGLRVFSLLIGLPVIALAYQLARQVSPPEQRQRSGFASALLVALSPLLWWAAQEARMYTFLALLVMIAALAWHRVIYKPSRVAWIALWTAELLLLYAHNAAPVVVLWLNFVTLIFWVSNRSVRVPDWRVWIGGQIVVLALWSPYFVTRFLLLADANSALVSAPQVDLRLIQEVWMAFWIAPFERITANFDPPDVFIVFLALYLGAFIFVKPRVRWLLAHTLILIIGLIVALIVLGNELHGRYLVMVAPLMLVGFAVSLARKSRGWLFIALVIVANLMAILSALDGRLPYRHDDARSMVAHYAQTLTPEDTVLAWSYADRYELAYYWDQLGVTANRVTLPEGADLEAILPLLPESGDVALNIWYTQRADFRGMMGCLLGNGTARLPETFITYGMSSNFYDAPDLQPHAVELLDMPFNDETSEIVRLVSVGEIHELSTAERALCLPLEWRVSRDLDVDLKAALIVRNPLGWEIARADAIIATADQRETSAADIDDVLRAFPLLRLPFGSPAGAYPIYLRLYDETVQPSGYVSPDNAAASGRDVQIGVWNVSPVASWEAVGRPLEMPTILNLAAADNLTLVITSTLHPSLPLQNGAVERLTLLWQRSGDPANVLLPPLILRSAESSWQVEILTSVTPNNDYTLDWREIRIPNDAPSGEAILELPNGVEIARLTIESLPMQLDPPPVETEIGAIFPTIGELVGFSLETAQPLSLDTPSQITVIWRDAPEIVAIDYTVFVQLIDSQGRVIAQSDSQPSGGTRPTTGWRGGEYITDSHALTYNALAAPGSATLIAGLYDAATNQRVRLADGSDFVELAILEVR